MRRIDFVQYNDCIFDNKQLIITELMIKYAKISGPYKITKLFGCGINIYLFILILILWNKTMDNKISWEQKLHTIISTFIRYFPGTKTFNGFIIFLLIFYTRLQHN